MFLLDRFEPLHPLRTVTVADGTAQAADRLRRVLTNDPATGVLRHADAGDDIALDLTHERGIRIPTEATP